MQTSSEHFGMSNPLLRGLQNILRTPRNRDIYLKAQMATLLNPACFSSVLRRYAAVAEDVEVLRGPSRLQRRNHLARMSVTVPSTDSALTLTPELRQTISATSMESPHAIHWAHSQARASQRALHHPVPRLLRSVDARLL